MKAEELRIGNYYDHYGEIKKVTPNTILEVWEAQRKWCKPIPLTEEWLLKFGAQKNPLSNEYWISVFNLKGELHFETFNNTDEIVTTLYSRSCQLIFDRIKYVHQLQNLYFALTGTELTIKS